MNLPPTSVVTVFSLVARGALTPEEGARLLGALERRGVWWRRILRRLNPYRSQP